MTVTPHELFVCRKCKTVCRPVLQSTGKLFTVQKKKKKIYMPQNKSAHPCRLVLQPMLFMCEKTQATKPVCTSMQTGPIDCTVYTHNVRTLRTLETKIAWLSRLQDSNSGLILCKKALLWMLWTEPQNVVIHGVYYKMAAVSHI